jgi:hypothetical protein
MMKKNLESLAACWLLFSVNAQAAPGEFWELSSSMEAMGMSMPAQTSKECIPLKDEGQPAGVDKNCKVSDVKRIPNGMTWKMSCNDGTSGSGKQTRTKDTITSDVLMNSSDGSMKMSMKGKRVGGSCDTGDKMKAVMAEAEKSCDLSNKKTSEVILGAANYTTKGALCAGKKEPFCSMVKRDVPGDIQAFESLDLHLKSTPDSNLVKACGLNVDASRKSLCKANAGNRKETGFLDRHCPAEAKALREKMRAEYCAGRQFTASSDKAKCLSGMDTAEDGGGSASGSSAAAEQGAGKSGNVATDAVQQGTKALKGLKDAFGF